MKCPFCNHLHDKVVDSRESKEGDAIRRRRECDKCSFRFSTYEEIEILDLAVIKHDGSRQPYSREKLERGIQRAFEKREHTDDTFKKIISAVEQDIQKKSAGGEVQSTDIGEFVMKRIKKVDKVAYIRFASVYRQFEDVDEFKEAIQKL